MTAARQSKLLGTLPTAIEVVALDIGKMHSCNVTGVQSHGIAMHAIPCKHSIAYKDVMLGIYSNVTATGLYNFVHARIPLPTKLNIKSYENIAAGYYICQSSGPAFGLNIFLFTDILHIQQKGLGIAIVRRCPLPT